LLLLVAAAREAEVWSHVILAKDARGRRGGEV